MIDDINTKRTELANQMAAAGAALLDFTATACALAAIPDTEPQQYVAAGTAENITAILPATISPARRLRHGERPSADSLSWEGTDTPAATSSDAPTTIDCREFHELAMTYRAAWPSTAHTAYKEMVAHIDARIERAAAPANAPAASAKRYAVLLRESGRIKKELRSLVIDVEAGIYDGDAARDARALLDSMDDEAPATASGDDLPDERARFEAWARATDQGFKFKGANRPADGVWYYFDDEEDIAWNAWQARAAVSAATKPTADLSKHLRDLANSALPFAPITLRTDEVKEIADVIDRMAFLLATKPAMVDAYVGAREDMAIWKRRALEAEESCRRLTAALNAENGPTSMGEPVIATKPAAAPAVPIYQRQGSDRAWYDTSLVGYQSWAEAGHPVRTVYAAPSATPAATVEPMVGPWPTVEMTVAGKRMLEKQTSIEHIKKYSAGIANAIYEAMQAASPIVPSDVMGEAKPERSLAQFLAAERAGVSFVTQEKCWNAWFGVSSEPPVGTPCAHCGRPPGHPEHCDWIECAAIGPATAATPAAEPKRFTLNQIASAWVDCGFADVKWAMLENAINRLAATPAASSDAASTADQVRNEALEEAAKLFDDNPHAEEYRSDVAATIRALKASTPAEEHAPAPIPQPSGPCANCNCADGESCPATQTTEGAGK